MLLLRILISDPGSGPDLLPAVPEQPGNTRVWVIDHIPDRLVSRPSEPVRTALRRAADALEDEGYHVEAWHPLPPELRRASRIWLALLRRERIGIIF